MRIGQVGALGAVVLLLACAPVAPPVAAPVLRSDFSAAVVTSAPRQAAGECWHGSVRPAVFETVTELVEVRAEQRDATGAVIVPGLFRTDIRQTEARPRQPVWFRVPCPEDGAGAPSFIASLQRALKARGYFSGTVTGEMDAETDAAVLSYQSANGLDNAVLSLMAAQSLGLVTVTR